METSTRRIVVLAPSTPAWRATIETLQGQCASATFDLLALSVTAEDLTAHLKHGDSQAMVVIVDICEDAVRGMNLVSTSGG